MSGFHEVLFPLEIALGARGGPQRRTDVVLTGSGAEVRNARWQNARRRYDAGYGLKSFSDLQALVNFFEERRGRLYGFRWRDRLDCKSCDPLANPTAQDQSIATGDGATASFQLIKTYGGQFAPYARTIAKPVVSSVLVAINGQALVNGVDFACDGTTGLITFAAAKIPAKGKIITAGFLFDVPARFDTDYLEVDLSSFGAGAIPNIPVVEIIP